jgi:NADPH:quinone reductase-like Zn-dependent oxidoreductase
MKAIVVREFGGPEVLRLEEVERPRPARGQVVVRVHAAGVNPADIYQRAGTYAVLRSGRTRPAPTVPASSRRSARA